MTFQLFIMQFITGVSLGLILALLACGLTIIMSLMGVVNFAHGVFYMLGAYFGFAVFSLTNNFWLAIVLAPLITSLIGLIIEITLLRRFYAKEFYYPLLATFILTLIFPDLIRIIFGTVGKSYNAPSVFMGALNIGFVIISKYRLFITLFAGLMLTFLWLFWKKTTIGITIRAAISQPIIVQTFGVNLLRLRTIVFTLGIFFAALGGVLAAPMRGIYPTMGSKLLLESFVILIVGGMGSLGGSIIAALLVGIIESFTAIVYGKAVELAIFLFLIVVLMVRPAGLFGEKGILSIRREI